MLLFENAWFQPLILECDELLSSFAFTLNLGHYNKGQLSRGKTAVLDTGDGAGWDLARQLLRPRSYDEVGCGNGSARCGERFGKVRERCGKVRERFGFVPERFGTVRGTVWQGAGTVWFRPGTVWHGAKPMWHSVGTVLYSAGPARHDDIQTNALAAPSTV